MLVKVLLISQNRDLLKRLHSVCNKNNYYFFNLDSLSDAKRFLLREDITVCFLTEELIENPISFISSLRECGCNTSFIYLGQISKDEIRVYLKGGFFDCVEVESDENELSEIIIEAIENKISYEKIRALANSLTEANNKLLSKTKELEVEKKHLSEVIDILKLVNHFIKEINHLDLNNLNEAVKRFLDKRIKSSYFFVLKYFENKKEICATNIPENIIDFKEILNNVIFFKKCNKEFNYNFKLDDKNVEFTCFPLYFNQNYYGHICVDSKLQEHDKLYVELLAEHLSMKIYNQMIIEKLKEAQDKIAENEKLKAIFALAVSLNHIINNNLLGISLSVEYLKKFCNDENLSKSFEIIDKNIKNISDVVKKLQEVKSIDYQEYLDGIKMIKFDEEKD
ncbi:hypothetical protein OWM07_05590 [Deferribacter thermophilus]|uniref:hypothetical protein n=1 Tax=Deferribacter thermophilus TaxID=53573 RepID=UPI003C28DA5B